MRRLAPHMLFTAPTGAAALHVGGATVHVAFNVRKRRVPHDVATVQAARVEAEDDQGEEGGAHATGVLREVVVLTPRLREVLRRLRVLAIDEISMLSAAVLDALDAAFRTARGRPDAPFGGVQLVLVGDFCQLAPVCGEYAFRARAWKALEGQMRVVSLTEVMRQESAEFVHLLHRARFGKLTTDDVWWLKAHGRGEGGGEEGAEGAEAAAPNMLAFANAACDARNAQQLAETPGDPVVFASTDVLRRAEPVFYEDVVLHRVVILLPGQTPPQWAAAAATMPEVGAALRAHHLTAEAWIARLRNAAVRTQDTAELAHIPHDVRVHTRAPARFECKPGARVRCTRNVYRRHADGTSELWLANGQLGTLVGLVDAEGLPVPHAEAAQGVAVRWDAVGPHPPRHRVVHALEYRCRQPPAIAKRLAGRADALLFHVRRALPLALAFARTVHTAQGSTVAAPCDVDLWHTARPDGRGGFQGVPGLVYVALSRLTDVVWLRLVGHPGRMPFHPDRCVADPAVVRFYEEHGRAATPPAWLREA